MKAAHSADDSRYSPLSQAARTLSFFPASGPVRQIQPVVGIFVSLVMVLFTATLFLPGVASAQGSSVEIGTIWFPAEDRGLGDDYQVGAVRVMPPDWLPGTRITIEVTTTYQQIEFTTDTGSQRYFGNGWLRVSFPGVTLAAGNVQDTSAPKTYGDEESRFSPPTDKAGAGWYRVGTTAGYPAIQPGVFRFSILAPTGRADFVRPQVEMFVEYPLPNPVFNGQYGSAIIPLRATPLDPLPGTLIKASAPTTPWGGIPQVNVAVSSAAGVPTGQVTVEGAGVEGSAALVSDGKAGHATVALPKSLPVGKHTLTVTYPGDGAFTGSTKTLELVIKKREPTVGARVTKDPTSLNRGKVRVTVSSSVSTSPGGRVTLTLTKDAKQQKVTGTLNNGAVDLRLPLLPAGTWNGVATYDGDPRFAKAQSNAINVHAPNNNGSGIWSEFFALPPSSR